MEQNANRRTEKKLGLNGGTVVVALLGLYGISCTAIQSWQVHTDDFAGLFAVGLCSLAISVLWLFMYWALDRLQHESIKMTLLTFFLSAVAYMAGKGVLTWIVGEQPAPFAEYVALPVVSFFALFAFVVVRFHSFDELVDSFIYGGFAGTGIAFVSCMTEFMQYKSLDGQFMIVELITRISVYAAICSLAGFSIHRHWCRKKHIRLALSVIMMGGFLALDYGIETYFLSDIAYADMEIVPVLISIGFVLVLVLSVVIKVHRILQKESSVAVIAAPKNHATSCIMVILVVFFLGSALYVRHNAYKTESYVSADGNWTFELPYYFYAAEETTKDAIFTFEIPTGTVFYRNQTGSVKLYLSHGAEKNVKRMLNIGSEYGWNVFVDYDQCITKDYRSKPMMLYQKIYYLQKGVDSIVIDAFTEEKYDSDALYAIRILMKTLERKDA